MAPVTWAVRVRSSLNRKILQKVERNNASQPVVDFKGKLFRTFIKNYEPFIYSFCVFLWALFYFIDMRHEWNYFTQEEYTRFSNVLSILGGYSVPTLVRILAHSSGMCVWYKATIAALALNLLDGLLNMFGILSAEVYGYFSIALGCIAIICFLIFKIFYRVTTITVDTCRRL